MTAKTQVRFVASTPKTQYSANSLCKPRCHGTYALLPAATVKGLDGHFLELALVHAAHIDALAMRVRSRHIKGLDTAVAAKGVLRHTRVKPVGRQHVFTLQETESLQRNNKVHESND